MCIIERYEYIERFERLFKHQHGVRHAIDTARATGALHMGMDGLGIGPGDEVIVHGEPIKVPYGEVQTFRRIATVKRAGWLEQLWTKISGRAAFMELLEFSFSERSKL